VITFPLGLLGLDPEDTGGFLLLLDPEDAGGFLNPEDGFLLGLNPEDGVLLGLNNVGCCWLLCGRLEITLPCLTGTCCGWNLPC